MKEWIEEGDIEIKGVVSITQYPKPVFFSCRFEKW